MKSQVCGTRGARRGGVHEPPHAWRVLPSSSREPLRSPKGHPSLGNKASPSAWGALPSSQDSGTRESPGAPRPPALRLRIAASQGLPGVFLHPKSEGSKCSIHLRPHTPTHLQCELPREPPRSCLSSPTPGPRHLSPEFLQKWDVSHTLAEKGSHLPPRRCGVLGLRASPRASPVCSLPFLDLCVCAPRGSRVTAVWSFSVSLSPG